MINIVRRLIGPAVICIYFMLLSPQVSGQSLSDWFDQLKEVHPAYQRALLERELAELSRERSLIEAGTDEASLRAEMNYNSSLSTLNSRLETFYRDAAEAAFTVALEQTDLQAAELRTRMAEDAYNRAVSRYDQGLVSKEEVEEKKIELEELERALAQAREAREEALSYYSYAAGMTWEDGITDAFSLYSWRPEKDKWLEFDYSLKLSRLQFKLASLRLEMLADNAPPGDRRVREIELKQAELAEKAALYESERNYAKTVLDLRSFREEALLAARKVELEEERRAAAKQRFEQGAISKQEYDGRQLSVYLAERTRLEGYLDYILLLFSTALSAGILPEEILR